MPGAVIPRRSVDERGASLIVAVGALTLLMTVAGFAVDLGVARTEKTLAANASDAGALGGAQDLPASATATNAGIAYVANTLRSTFGSGTVCGVNTTCFTSTDGVDVEISTPYPGPSGDPTKRIRVEVCWNVPTTFSNILQVSELRVCRSAVAQRLATPLGLCALCVLNPTGTSLSSTGPGALTVENGSIVVNSGSNPAAKITNPASGGIKASPAPPQTIGIVGTYSEAAPGQFGPTPSTGVTPIPDPFAAVPIPLPCGSPGAFPPPDCVGPAQADVSVSGGTSTTISPGVYDSIKSSSTGTITMQPGIYVIKKELTLNKSPAPGNTSLVAPGVLLYFACSAYPSACASGGQSGGKFTMTGGATATISGPTAGLWAGMSMFFDRANTSSITLTGSSCSSFTGSIYIKVGETSLTGTSGNCGHAAGTPFTLNSMVVTGSLTKTGDTQVKIAFDPDYNFGGAAGQGAVALVE